MAGPYSSSQAVVNAALELIAAQTQITSLNDGSPAAAAASVIYTPVVQLMLREMDPAFARLTATLTIQAGTTAPSPWTYAYAYPSDCVRLRQVRPPASGTGSLADVNNPYPVKANVAVAIVSAAPVKVIFSNQQNALAVYTSSSVVEADWDSDFSDAAVRRLANPLAMALSGRPDFANAVLQQAAMSEQIAGAADEGIFTRRA